ncbi:hypothetical protein C8K15_12427 [Paenisporosarcina sp. OV554]|nr:hypothetical protein C8K15_12427 [Paenisporosarcina sp. OV554]
MHLFAADGRSVNNALGFPGIFRGALNAGVNDITYPMFVAAAALAIANHTKPGDLIPNPLDPTVHQVLQEQLN